MSPATELVIAPLTLPDGIVINASPFRPVRLSGCEIHTETGCTSVSDPRALRTITIEGPYLGRLYRSTEDTSGLTPPCPLCGLPMLPGQALDVRESARERGMLSAAHDACVRAAHARNPADEKQYLGADDVDGVVFIALEDVPQSDEPIAGIWIHKGAPDPKFPADGNWLGFSPCWRRKGRDGAISYEEDDIRTSLPELCADYGIPMDVVCDRMAVALLRGTPSASNAPPTFTASDSGYSRVPGDVWTADMVDTSGDPWHAEDLAEIAALPVGARVRLARRAITVERLS